MFKIRVIEYDKGIIADSLDIVVHADNKGQVRKMIRTIEDGKYANHAKYRLGKIWPHNPSESQAYCLDRFAKVTAREEKTAKWRADKIKRAAKSVREFAEAVEKLNIGEENDS